MPNNTYLHEKLRILTKDIKHPVKSDHYHNGIINTNENIKKEWNDINNRNRNKNPDKSTSVKDTINDKEVTENKTKCDEFNKFFVNVGANRKNKSTTMRQRNRSTRKNEEGYSCLEK